jgi:hypothetical protein
MSNLQKNDDLSTPSARRMTDIIDVHSHIITNLGSQAPTDKLPPWSNRRSNRLHGLPRQLPHRSFPGSRGE